MDRKLSVTITLTEADIKDAVAYWLNNQPPWQDYWEAKDVHVSASMKWVGNGVNESQMPKAKIEVHK
jgi:hypothetical protein